MRKQKKYNCYFQWLCLDVNAAGEGLWLCGNPCWLSCFPQHSCMEKSEALLGLSHRALLSQLLTKGWEFCNHRQISHRYKGTSPVQDHQPDKFWICVTLSGRWIFSEERPPDLFNLDENTHFYSVLGNGWVHLRYFFLLNVPPHQGKTLEAAEEILTHLTGLSPVTSVVVRLFTLLFTANKTVHSIIYPQISFSSKAQMTCYPSFPMEKFCSHREILQSTTPNLK